MATWPSSLPASPIAGTLSIVPESNLAEYRPDVGEPIRRRRFVGSRVLYSAQVTLEDDQIETLRSFFHDDLFDGVLPFDMYDWWNITAGSPTVASFSFVEPYELAHVDVGIYRATLKLSKIV